MIIIFGAAVRPDGSPSGAMRDRVAAALRFGATLGQAEYMPTGGIGRHGEAEADVMARMLREAGVPAGHIHPERTARNTIGSVQACAALLRGHSGPVYAATSAYHMPRCLVLLRLAGLDARPCPPHDGPAAASLPRRWYWRLREIPALPLDAMLLMGRRLAGALHHPAGDRVR